MLAAVVCCLVYFSHVHDEPNESETQKATSDDASDNKKAAIKPFPWERVTSAESEEEAGASQSIKIPILTSDNDWENKNRTIRELEEIINSQDASEIEAIRAAEELTVVAFDESRLAWITSKLEENMSRHSLNEEQRAQAFENACSVIGHTIDPSANLRLAISYAAYCENEKPDSKELQYNLALVTSVTGNNTDAIAILEKMPEKNEEAIFLLAQLYQRNGDHQESAKYANLLRTKNTSLAEYLLVSPSNH